jgi:hypothetical protein
MTESVFGLFQRPFHLDMLHRKSSENPIADARKMPLIRHIYPMVDFEGRAITTSWKAD